MEATNSSLLIHVATQEYPVYLWVMKSRFPTMAFGDNVSTVTLDELGYAIVYPVDPPAGDVVTEGAPELVNGEWKQTWVVRDYDPDELAQLLEGAKATAEMIAQEEFNLVQSAGVSVALASGAAKLSLSIEQISSLNGQHDDLILTSDKKVASITSGESTSTYATLRAKRQLLLAAYGAQIAAIAASTHYLSVPQDADIRAAINGSVL